MIRGELDSHTVPALEAQLSRAVSMHLVLDLSHVEFMDLRGAAAVVKTAADARLHGRDFTVAPNASESVLTVFEHLQLPFPP